MEALDNLSLCEQFSDNSTINSPPFSVGKLLDVDVDSISPSAFDMSGESRSSCGRSRGPDDTQTDNKERDGTVEKSKGFSTESESTASAATAGAQKHTAVPQNDVPTSNGVTTELEAGHSRWNFYQNFLDLAQPLGPMPPQVQSGGMDSKHPLQFNAASNNTSPGTRDPRTATPVKHEHPHPMCHTNSYADFTLCQSANSYAGYGNQPLEYSKTAYPGNFSYLPQLQGATPIGHPYSAGPWTRPYYSLPVRKRPYRGPNDESPGEPDSSTGGTPPSEHREGQVDGGESNCNGNLAASVTSVGPVASVGGVVNQRPGPYNRGRRICFSSSQVQELENSFLKDQYCNPDDRKALAGKLGLTETQIKNWFQNRRSKEKRRQKKEVILSALTCPNISLDSCGPGLPDVRLSSHDEARSPSPTPPPTPPAAKPEPYPTILPPWTYHQYPQSAISTCGIVAQPSSAAWTSQSAGIFGPGGFQNPYAMCYPGYPYFQFDHLRSQMVPDQDQKIRVGSSEQMDVKKETV